jgi:recombination protein RecA
LPAPPRQIGIIYGNPEVTSGGNALKFYSSVRLEVRRKATIEGAKGENIGIRVKAKVHWAADATVRA